MQHKELERNSLYRLCAKLSYKSIHRQVDNMASHQQCFRLGSARMVAKFRALVHRSRKGEDAIEHVSHTKPGGVCRPECTSTSHSSLLSIVHANADSSAHKKSFKIPITRAALSVPTELSASPLSLRRPLALPRLVLSRPRPAPSPQPRLEPLWKVSSDPCIIDDWLPIYGDKMKTRIERKFRAIQKLQEQHD